MRATLFIVALCCVVRLTTGSCGYPPIRSTGFWGKIFTSFTGEDDLKKPPQNLRNAFILVKHGMVVPSGETYPKDWFFKTKWKRGKFTTHGKRMMAKLGRSLATRYSSFLQHVPVQDILVTTMNTDYGVENAQEIMGGLIDGIVLPPISKRADIDKFQLFKLPSYCAAYLDLKYRIPEKTCDENTRTLFEYLAEHAVGRKHLTHDNHRWYIKSREGLYDLWEILDFERKSKQWAPYWYDKRTRADMHYVAGEYLNSRIFGDREMTPLVVGTLFQEVLDGFYKYNRKFHLHVTNDLTYAAFKSVLVQSGVSAPQFGETLMVEVDTDFVARVHTYKPYRSNFQDGLLFGNGQSSYELSVIRDRLEDLRLPITDEEWIDRCGTYDDNGAYVPTHRLPSYPQPASTRWDEEALAVGTVREPFRRR